MKIKDNYLRFWFAFIYLNQSLIESGNGQVVMQKIKNGFVSYHAASVHGDKDHVWHMETVKKYVAKEPLYRVHECVFAVLAFESEPVDPRL
jgi:hypothetical protein